jgi:hypothetical protein
MDELKCSRCGADLTSGARFCPFCGMEQKEEPVAVFCEACGTELTPTQLFCHVCGKKIIQEEKTQAEEKKPLKGNLKKKILGWVRHSLVLLIAILFISLAFLPTVSFKNVEMLSRDYDFSFSAIDGIVFCFDAMHSLDDEKLDESKLGEELNEFFEEDEIPTAKEMRIVIKLVVRLAMQSKEMKFRPQYAIFAFLSLVYLLLSVAFFVVSLIDFIFFAIGKENKKLFRASFAMLTLIPSVTVMAPLSFMSGVGAASNKHVSFSDSVVAILVCSLIALAYFSIEHYFLSEKKIKVSVKGIIKRTLATVASVLMLFSAILPMATYEVKAHFIGSDNATRASRELCADFFNNFLLGESMEEECGELTTDDVAESAEDYAWYNRQEFKNGYANDTDFEVLVGGFCLGGGVESTPFIFLVSLFVLMISLIGAILLWQNILALTSDASPHPALTIPFKTFGVFFAAAALALVIVFLVVTNHNLKYVDFENVKVSLKISAGAILMVVFAIFGASVPMKKKKQKHYTENGSFAVKE